MLLINKTHTCPLKERYYWKGLVSMKISDIILFKHPLPFYAENLTPPTLVNFEKSNPFCKCGRRMAVVATMSITPENVKNLWFSDVSRGYRNITLGLNGWVKHSPTSPLHKGGRGGSDFSKIAVMGGSKIFTRNGGEPGMMGWFYNRGMGTL